MYSADPYSLINITPKPRWQENFSPYSIYDSLMFWEKAFSFISSVCLVALFSHIVHHTSTDTFPRALELPALCFLLDYCL